MLMCISEIKNRGTLFLCKNFVAHMFSMKRSRTTKCITVSKTCLKTKLKILFFFSKLVILKTIYGRLIINRFSSPSVLSFSSFSLVDAETSGYFQDCESLVPILYRFSKYCSIQSVARWGGGGGGGEV